MKIPEPSHSISALIDQAHERRQEPPRPHLGASMLGHPCDRYLWLNFRWAVQEEFSGRILRLFRRGQLEENQIVRDLRSIGIDIRQTGSYQMRVDFGSHVSGSLDGIIERGVPEAPKKKHIAEFKTHSKKSFDDIEKNGVEKSKPLHFAQCQLYMHGTEIDRALYVAICKDDDRIYTERIRYDEATALKLIEKGHRIALADRMPEPLSADPSWYQCKFCPAHEFCFYTKQTKHVNCRTCAHSTALEDSTWRCERHDADGIPVEFQRTGCDSHVLHPDLVPWQRKDSDNEWQAVYFINGKDIKNGDPADGAYASKELLSNAEACVEGDAFVERLRNEMGAKIIG